MGNICLAPEQFQDLDDDDDDDDNSNEQRKYRRRQHKGSIRNTGGLARMDTQLLINTGNMEENMAHALAEDIRKIHAENAALRAKVKMHDEE